MCGIAGLGLTKGEATPATLQTMCDRIRHRGSDDEGFHEDEGVEGLHRLRGMLAFPRWDFRRRRLLLARGRAGKKPQL